MISPCEKEGSQPSIPFCGHHRKRRRLVILIVDIAGGLVL